MQHLKMTQPGWETYTGPLFGVNFENGRSTTIVDPGTAGRIASIVAVENDDGKNPSPSQAILDNGAKPAVLADLDVVPKDNRGPVVRPDEVYTREQLEELADKHGITALRTIGDRMGVKGVSIVKLIESIMAWQAAHLQPAAPVEAPVEAGAEAGAGEAGAEAGAGEQTEEPKAE